MLHVPAVCSESMHDPAFHMGDMTFRAWCPVGGDAWCKGEIIYPPDADPDGSAWMLSYCAGGPATCHEFAGRYDGVDVPPEAIARIYWHEPLSPGLIAALGALRSYDVPIVEAAKIGYPVA